MEIRVRKDKILRSFDFIIIFYIIGKYKFNLFKIFVNIFDLCYNINY